MLLSVSLIAIIKFRMILLIFYICVIGEVPYILCKCCYRQYDLYCDKSYIILCKDERVKNLWIRLLKVFSIIVTLIDSYILYINSLICIYLLINLQ